MEGKPYIVTYCDVIYANSEKEAYIAKTIGV